MVVVVNKQGYGVSMQNTPTNIAKSFVQRLQGKTAIGDKRIVTGTFPLATGGLGVARSVPIVARGFGRFFTAGKNLVARQFVNPFAGATIKQGLKNVGKKIGGFALTGGLFGLAYTGSKALVTGETPSASVIGKGFIHGGLAGANPFGALAGAGAGITELGVSKIPTDFNTPNINFPTSPSMNIPNAPDFSFTSPASAPISFTSPSSNVSVSGGGSSNLEVLLPLLIALLGVGGAYAYLRSRKKKKKKYKKRSV